MLTTDGRVALISGAARGIGRAIAKKLHADGFTLSLGARDLDALESMTRPWVGAPVSLHHFDAFEPESQRAWVDETIDTHGRLDVLVNNAGVIAPWTFDDFDEESLDTMWEVNVKTPARMTHLALPHLRAAGDGRVINMASLSAKRVRGGFEPGYAMTKHAVLALTHATRQEGWADGVRATAVCPSFVDTEMIAGVEAGPEPIIDPNDLVELISTTLCLPGSASVAELIVTCRLEDSY